MKYWIFVNVDNNRIVGMMESTFEPTNLGITFGGPTVCYEVTKGEYDEISVGDMY